MTRVFIVAAVCLYREGLAAVLAKKPGIEVVGAAEDAAEAIAELRHLRPRTDVVLLDGSAPNGVSGVRRILHNLPGMRVVVLALPELEDEVLAYVEAGAAGCVTRDAWPEELMTVVQGVVRGDAHLSPAMTGALLRRIALLAGSIQSVQARPALTAREREIVELIEQGLSNKEIASGLHVELPTVKNHVHRILEKLGVGCRAEAATWVREGGTGVHRNRHALSQAGN